MAIDDVDLRSARDWAHSVQIRLAEKLSGEMAKDAGSDTFLTGPHRHKVESLLIASGMSKKDALEVLNSPASLKISELDDPRTRDTIDRILGVLFELMQLLEMRDLSDKVLVSSLASGSINALVAKGTWDPIVHIFVDADLLVFVSSIAKIVSQCLADGETASLTSKAETNRTLASAEVRAAIFDLFRATTILGSARASKPFLIPANLLGSWHMLNQTMGAFVLGHELAHVLLGHIDDEEAAATGSIPEVQNADVLLFSHEAEFHADRDGAILAATSAYAHNGSLLDIASPYIFMRALDLLEACETVVGRERGDLASTHPSAHQRSAFIRQVLVDKLPCGCELVMVLERIDEFMDGMAKLVLADMNTLTAAGITPVTREKLRVYDKPAILG